MSAVDTGVWTCPVRGCGETVRGTVKARKFAQGVHARRHRIERADIRRMTQEANAAAADATRDRELRIPPPPTTPRRRR